MQVDPSGLASAVQRITAALAQLPTGDEVHPPLGADPASQGGAARLTSGARDAGDPDRRTGVWSGSNRRSAQRHRRGLRGHRRG